MRCKECVICNEIEIVPQLFSLGAVLLLHLAHDAAVRALHRQQPLLAERAQLLDLLLVARAQPVAVRVRGHGALLDHSTIS